MHHAYYWSVVAIDPFLQPAHSPLMAALKAGDQGFGVDT